MTSAYFLSVLIPNEIRLIFVLRFMWTLHTANPEHWVPIKTVASFKRMREFQDLGLEWITQALRLSEELEIDASGTNVRRKTEVQEPKGQFERSIYAVSHRTYSVCDVKSYHALQKGFGPEIDGLQKKLEDFFDQYGKTNAVRMRRVDNSKEFKV